MQAASEFGLTPSARSRIMAAYGVGKNEEDETEALLGGADQNPGYKVFDADGKVAYEPNAAEPAVKVQFLVKVSISGLNIMKGPGTDYDRVQFIPVGVYTIMEVRSGKGRVCEDPFGCGLCA